MADVKKVDIEFQERNNNKDRATPGNYGGEGGNSAEASFWDDPVVKKIVTYVKYIISSGLTMTYIIYLMWGIWTNEAVLPGPGVAHFIIFTFCITLVAYLEGLQVAILACENQDPSSKRESHPRGYKLIQSVRAGNNVERFLVGRQFFTVFVMTLMAQVTAFPDISHLGINAIVWFVLIQTGLPGAMVVTTVGSLQPQLLAAKDPWKFLDLYGTNAVLNLCYGLEASGICTHFAWGLIWVLRRTLFITDQEPKKHDVETTFLDNCVEGLKYLLSTTVILTYFLYLQYGIWSGKAILPVPPIVVFLIFCGCFLFLAFLEGLQVAILVAEAKDNEPYKITHPRGYELMKRATDEKNVRRFLIGRQFFVIFVVFLINQCTIFPDISKFGINNVLWFIFVQLGLPTALNILCLAQLPAQLLGNQDPMMFMQRLGPRFTLEVCLFTEATGLAHFSWVVTSFSKATWFRITANKLDEIDYKDVENNKADVVTENGKTPHFESDELQLEQHNDVAHILNDEDAGNQL